MSHRRHRSSRARAWRWLPAAAWAAVALAAADGLGGTVTLQQGADGYAGCTGATLWEPKTAKPKDGVKPGVLYVRGTVGYRTRYTADVKDPKTGQIKKVAKTRYREAGNRVCLRFDLPKSLAGKKVRRARLEVFVPAVRRLKMINEILCREVTQAWTAQADWTRAAGGAKWTTPGGTMDLTTDYDNGRPKGAVDSYAFWEFKGQYFPHQYDFLLPAKAGQWIDFNVTPLVAKWLADPTRNHGVALEPITQGDKRFMNRMAIDIPSPTGADAAHRPRLVLDVEPLGEAYRVGMTHGLRKYCDRSTRYRFFGPWTDKHQMAMARNEFEPFQVMVYPVRGDLKSVTFDVSDLAGPGGAKIPAADVTYNCQEMLLMHPNGKTRDWYFHGKRFWIPDPLSHARPLDCKRHVATPFWFTVRTRPQTAPGTYTGTITVKPGNAKPRKLALTVKVWNYKVPERWNFQTMGQSCWGNYWRCYDYLIKKAQADGGREAAAKKRAELRRQYIDFLMDRRFMPTEQYSSRLSPSLADIPYCVAERGGNTIYLNGAYKSGERNLKSLRQRYDAVIALDGQLRADGKYTHPERLIDMSLVYIGDETSKWDLMRANSNTIRRVCPKLMIMIGGSFPRAELDGVIDIYDPQIGGSSKTYSLTEAMAGKIAGSQAKGERFFWYDAAGPMLPYPNVQCEEPLIASRSVFWMTWKYGVTGFEYYCYAIWSHNFPSRDGKRWPEKPFTSWGWGQTNGDGMLFYPGPTGPFSSVRFENIRDGIEDWESHFVLRDCAEALAKKGAKTARAKALLAKAKKLLKVPDEVVKDLRTWSWQPEVLLAARRDLGETIDAFSRLVSEEEILAVRLERKKAELKRQYNMLKRRAAAAGKAAPKAVKSK